MRLRLYHHHDGARIAYREAGTGPPLALVHSAGLSHREWEPVVEHLTDRFRLVLPDLPLHGDSEDRLHHPYTPDWLAGVLAGFAREVLGPRPLVGGHELGALLLLRAVVAGALRPGRLVLMPSPLHRKPGRARSERLLRAALHAAAVPAVDRALARAAPAVIRPALADGLSVTGNPAVRDLLRHAVADLPGHPDRVRAWRRAMRHWPARPWTDLLDAYRRIDVPVLLLWADSDPAHPLEIAEEAVDLLPQAQLRVLNRTGFLVAYDDAVGVARELAAFCA